VSDLADEMPTIFLASEKNYAIALKVDFGAQLLQRSRSACSLLWRLCAVGGSNRSHPEIRHHVKSPSGYPIQSPYVSIANRQAEIMMRIASEFCFTPASRSRISTPIKNEPNLFDLFGSLKGPDGSTTGKV
jgi:Phage terminase, small subunit